MSEFNIYGLKFTTIDKFIENFRAPTTAEIYDHKTERAVVLNKFNFSQEIIESRNTQTQGTIIKLEKEVDKVFKEIDKSLIDLSGLKQSVVDTGAATKVKILNQKISKLYNAQEKYEISIKRSSIEPLMVTSLDEKSKEYLKDSIGVIIKTKIPVYKLENLKSDFNDSKITKNKYEERYNSLAEEHSKIDLTNFIEKQKDFFTNFLKPLIIKEYVLAREPIYQQIPKELENFKKLVNLYRKDFKGNEKYQMIYLAHVMLASNPNKINLLDETSSNKLKNQYSSSEIIENVWTREINGKLNICEKDLENLIEAEKNGQDIKFEIIIDLLQLGYDNISNPIIENHYAKIQFDIQEKTYNHSRRIAKDGMKKVLKESIGEKSPFTNQIEEFASRMESYMTKIGYKIFDQFPSHINEHVGRGIVRTMARSFKEAELNMFLMKNYDGFLGFAQKNWDFRLGHNELIRKSEDVKGNYLYSINAYGSLLSSVEDLDVADKWTLDKKQLPWDLNKENVDYLINSDFLDLLTENFQNVTMAEIMFRYNENLINFHTKAEPHIRNAMNRLFRKMLEIYIDKFQMKDRPLSPKKMILTKLKTTLNDLENNGFPNFLNMSKPSLKDNQQKINKINSEKFSKMKADFQIIKRLLASDTIKKTKSPHLSEIINLEKNRGVYISKHNGLLAEIKEEITYKEELLEKHKGIVEKLKDLKISNHVVTNNVDNGKFIATMKTIVDMTQIGDNKNSIINLTDMDNLDNSIDSLDKLLGEDLDVISRNALIMTYITDMNRLYDSRGHTEEYEELSLNHAQQRIIQKNNKYMLSPGNPRDYTFPIEMAPNGRDIIKEGMKIYEGKHFPLFIDKESLSIWSVEWTSKYPTLTISTVPPEFVENMKTKSFDKFFEERTEILGRPIKGKKVYNELYIDEVLKYHEEWFNKQSYNMSRFAGVCEPHANSINRIRELFSLIQSNYFIQLRQPEERGLFLDIDPNYLEKHNVNIGAIPFLNEQDLRMIDQFNSYKSFKDYYDQNLIYINPFNFESSYGDKITETTLRKIYGLNSEFSSKEKIKTILKKVKDINTSDLYENDEELLKESINYIYGNAGFTGNILPDNIKELLDENISKLRLFANIDDLEKYRKDYEQIMNKL